MISDLMDILRAIYMVCRHFQLAIAVLIVGAITISYFERKEAREANND